ncbi:two component regulator with propeller domain [Mucilaginibacter yixingensis]|uniref:Two component regulator with propeller domain n=2 Tax=Mucilaginibacter yixingensis TaxID=1295612 RepID=A0A2T5JDY4_9SPHI|nr:two component regulator with propeller domain [Mucilaginibacter yixingensis]
MRSLKSWFFGSLCLLFPLCSSAQYMYKEKVADTRVTSFCYNCGTPKAQYDPEMFERIAHAVERRYNLAASWGSISYQILVDTAGNGQVLSYNDASHSQLSRDIIGYLNVFRWKPAKVNDKSVFSSVDVTFTIGSGMITGKVSDASLDDFADNVIANHPLIINKRYFYQNQSLGRYQLTVWNKNNSLLPDNVSQCNAVDRTGVLWYATGHGIITFAGGTFRNVPQVGTPGITSLAIDNTDVKWMYSGNAVYRNAGSTWQKYDLPKMGFTSVNNITATKTGEVIFSTEKGLLIIKNGQFTLVNKQRFGKLPTNQIEYAYYDKRGRLWVGTNLGSVLIDKSRKVTVFNGMASPLNGTCITAATEDPAGNLYFALRSIRPYSKDADGNTLSESDAEGIAVYTANGKWLHYNDKNSGLPSNQINSLLYDRFEKVLWVGTHRSGLARYNPHNYTWELYHNENSNVPDYDIYQLSQDGNGSIYASTYKGLLVVSRRIGG